MNLYQQYIAKSKYARYLDDKQRREHWPETVKRYFDFLSQHLSDMYSYDLSGEERRELEEAVLNLEVMPSMRLMMTAGEAAQRQNLSAYNPVAGNTLVVTKEYGNVAISQLEGLTAHVINKNNQWTVASFKCYGVQELFTVTFGKGKNYNNKKAVECTSNHRWLLKSGEVVSTDQLKIGDKVCFTSLDKTRIPLDLDYDLGIKHGLIYGDGTAQKSCQRVKGYHIRLCGKNAELLTYFNNYPVTYPASANGDPVVMMYDSFAHTHALKELPSGEETDSYLLGFIRGWLASDGSLTKKGNQVSICGNEKSRDWLLRYAEKVGFSPSRVQQQPEETNLGKRKESSYKVYFHGNCLIYADLLASWHRDIFKGPVKTDYVVSAVTPLGEKGKVFCAEVPDTNTFTLSSGLVTGNCAFVAIDDPKAFDEAMYILMCGTGVGFSVERQFVNKLPEIPETLYRSETTIVVRDSKEGWAKAFRQLIALLYSGEIPKWDMTKVRKAGARLRIFGGRSSGPDVLEELFNFTIRIFKQAEGRKLTSIECHDIMCKIGEIVVVGGVRRSALISLSNLSDDRMRKAKSGEWWTKEPQRSLANNSAVYTEKPSVGAFMEEWLSLYESKSGERGIFNRQAADLNAKRTGRRKEYPEGFGTNPCGEITLRNCGLCNLTEVVVRPGDTWEKLGEKVRLATILGTFQSTLTYFPYVRKIWQRNAEEERLLGVSLTGIMDNELTQDPNVYNLEDLKNFAIDVNRLLSEELGINPSASITCTKPSGTVSQLVNCSSGIHGAHAPYYIRRVRGDNKDPLTKFLISKGIPSEACVMRPESTTVFSFPIKAASTSKLRTDMNAIDQLDVWLKYKLHYTEHNPSVTVSVKEHEWVAVGAWVYDNFDEVQGVSFLPYDGHTYKQAPYEEITEEEYNDALSRMPTEINWDELIEIEDNVEGAQNLACSGGFCEL